MLKIYHNPRCSKSRDGLTKLESIGQPFEIIKYIDTPPSEQELKDLLKLLNLKPIEIVRTKEALWKENYKDRKLTNSQIIKILVKNPRLIERPIIVNNDRAVIGRPVENIDSILQ